MSQGRVLVEQAVPTGDWVEAVLPHDRTGSRAGPRWLSGPFRRPPDAPRKDYFCEEERWMEEVCREAAARNAVVAIDEADEWLSRRGSRACGSWCAASSCGWSG